MSFKGKEKYILFYEFLEKKRNTFWVKKRGFKI